MTRDRDRAAVRTAVLLSGSGRTLANLLARIGSDGLPLDIVGVVSSRPGVRGLDVAAEAGIPSAVFRRKDYPGVREHNGAVNAWLEPLAPRLIVLAGYLCFYVHPDWFTGPVVNIHPALLPKFGGQGYYGDRVHQAVLEAGEKVTGCTVHLVDDQYDHGRILGRQEVPVLPGDDVHSLADRVFAAECELYPRVLADLARTLL
ncbi:phosphoribosylglycinamide formyltransferase [bacterium]|nr:phosphoribosylglycinamide formyltransferase [bacterium]